MKNYSFTNKAIVRTPLGEKQLDLSWDKIVEIFSKKENREGLFLGSPNIYKALETWERKEAFQTEDDFKKLQRTLYKYASRLSNRSTPFGLFATVSCIDINKNSKIVIKEDSLSRYTKYDMHFLGVLLPILTKENVIRTALKYYPNNSIYTIFDKYRYVEYYFKDNVRLHKISEVEITEYLDFVIEKSKKGVLISDLISSLVTDEISEQDVLEFINTIIESQLLVSELEFTITGEDYFERLIQIFSEERFSFYEALVIKDFLINLKKKINDLDTAVLNNPSKYLKIHESLKKEINNVDVSKLFQVDSYRTIENGSLGFKTLQHLRSAITVLNKLQSKSENENLKTFKQKFVERFEEYEQPLVKVLDPDIGIGYGKQSHAKTPLVDELVINLNDPNERLITLDAKKTFLLKKLLKANQGNKFSIELTNEEINTFEEEERLYPDSFSVFFNAFNESGTEKIHLKSVSGSSANNLIGRFSHLNEKIFNLCNEILNIETALHTDKIIAEIVHLPEARTGNILYRSFQRKYEIPYLANSSLDLEHQIHISDLYISIKKGKIVLRSKKLNKEVIPKLSNAHNFSSNVLPIYHFLCDIQNQEDTGFEFSWGALQHDFEFLPRLSYNNVILSKATWNLSKGDINEILSNDESKAIEVIQTFRTKRNIPDIIFFTHGDNEVLINFNNDLSCLVFYSMLKGNNFVKLTEFLFKENSLTNNYCNEFIVSAYRNIDPKKEVNSPVFSCQQNKESIVSSFTIGDEWLYYKFYCGERTAEDLLNKAINPIVSALKSKKLIKKWFFIRYRDNKGHHLRFRILLNEVHKFTECIEIIKKKIKPFEDAQIIWKTQTDTYLREFQRYGDKAIEHTETLFNNDSECTLQFTALLEGDSGEKIRWKFALLSIHSFIEDFNFSLIEKVELLKAAKTGFGNEFNRSGLLNKQINEMYSNSEKEIENFLDKNKTEDIYIPIWEIIKERSKNNQEAVTKIKQLSDVQILPSSLFYVTLSYLHMICNRIFIAKQRTHEMVVYDFLYKYYSKQLHTKSNKKEKELITILSK